MKSSNVEVKAKLRRIAYTCLAILSLAVSANADEFKLARVIDSKVSDQFLGHLDKDRTEAIKLLVGEPQEQDFTKYVNTYKTEPFKFVEGIREAILEKMKAKDANIDVVKAAIRDGFKSVKSEAWGADERALGKLVEAIVGAGGESHGLDKVKLESGEFLEILFTAEIQKALKLGKKTEVATALPPKSETPAVGEQSSISDAAIDALAAQMCEAELAKIEAEKRSQDKIAELEKNIADAKEQLNRLAQLKSQAEDVNDRNDRKNAIADLINPLLAELNDNDNRRKDLIPPPQQLAQLPLPLRNDNRNQDFRPAVPPETQPQGGPTVIPSRPMTVSTDIRSVLPKERGLKELADGQSAVSNSTNITQKANALSNDPYLMMGQMLGGGMMNGPVNPMFAFLNAMRLREVQNEVKTQLAMNTANLKNIDTRISALNKMLEKYKDAKSALSAEDKKKELDLKAAIEDKERGLKTAEALVQSVDPIERQNAVQNVVIKQADLDAQKSELKKFNDALGLKLVDVEGDLDNANSTLTELQAVKSKLEASNSDLSSKDGSLSTMLAQITFGNVGTQPQGRPSVYPTGGNGAPRTAVPQRAAGLPGAMDPKRGSLASTAKP